MGELTSDRSASTLRSCCTLPTMLLTSASCMSVLSALQQSATCYASWNSIMPEEIKDCSGVAFFGWSCSSESMVYIYVSIITSWEPFLSRNFEVVSLTCLGVEKPLRRKLWRNLTRDFLPYEVSVNCHWIARVFVSVQNLFFLIWRLNQIRQCFPDLRLFLIQIYFTGGWASGCLLLSNFVIGLSRNLHCGTGQIQKLLLAHFLPHRLLLFGTVYDLDSRQQGGQ